GSDGRGRHAGLARHRRWRRQRFQGQLRGIRRGPAALNFAGPRGGDPSMIGMAPAASLPACPEPVEGGSRKDLMSRARRLVTRFPVLLGLLALSAACDNGVATPIAPPETVPFQTNDLVVGTGADAAAGRRATVNYTGWLYDATKVDNKG